MLLETIEVQGFSSYKGHTTVDIPMGITGIMGSIADSTGAIVEGKSNGSGKSSIVMALLYALYGVGEYSKQEEIWNDQLDKKDEAFVKVVFKLNGNVYSITRGKKGKSAYIDVMEGDKRIGDSNEDSQEFIVNLLGMDSKLFKVSVFFMQGDLSAFIKSDPAIRKQYIDTILDLGLWREASKSCRKSADTENKGKVELEGDIDKLNELIKGDASQITELEEMVSDIPNLQTEKKGIDDEIAKIQTIDSTLKLLKGYEDIQRKAEEKRKINEDVLYITADNIKVVTAEYATKSNEYDKYKLFDLDYLQRGIVTLGASKDSINKSISDISAEMSKLSESNIKLSTTLDLYKTNILDISSGVCDRCKQPISQDFISEYNKTEEDRIAALEVQLNAVSDNISLYTTNLANKQEELIAVGDSISSNEQKINDVNKAGADFAIAEEKYNTNIKQITAQREIAAENIKNVNLEISEYNLKIKETKAQLPADNYNKGELMSALHEIESKLQDLYAKSGMLENIKKEQEERKNNLEKCRDSLKNTEATLYYLQVLGVAFKEIPASILKESIGEIEDDANEFIQSVYPDYNIKIYEDESKVNRPLLVDIEVGGRRRNYKLLSGGQQSICSIGLRIGFNKVISRRAKVSLNFLVLDEIFSALDGFNRTEILKTLTSLNNFFPQIIAITHTEEAALFPNIIHVLMDSHGTSRILEKIR